MTGFNPDAERHPCAACEHGGVWKEGGKLAGNFCRHPKITSQPGKLYGIFFSTKRPHRLCPKKEALQEDCKAK